MQVNWLSRQGDARRRNNDAAAVGFGETHLIVVLVDGADKGTGGAALAPPCVKIDVTRSRVDSK